MDVSTNFSPVRITLNKSKDFDILWGVLEDSIENYEKNTIERNFLVDMVNHFSGIYSFQGTNTTQKANYEVDNGQIQTDEDYISQLERKITDLGQYVDLNQVDENKNPGYSVGYPVRQTRADWTKYTLEWARGVSLDFFDFNEPGWHPLPNGQEEWYGYDKDIAYRINKSE